MMCSLGCRQHLLAPAIPAVRDAANVGAGASIGNPPKYEDAEEDGKEELPGAAGRAAEDVPAVPGTEWIEEVETKIDLQLFWGAKRGV